MKNLKVIGLVILAFIALTACEKDDRCINGSGGYVSRTYQTPTFNSLAIAGEAEVIITRDSVHSLRIEAQSNVLNELNVEFSGGELSIGEDNCFRQAKKLKVYVSTPVLTRVETAGSIDVSSTDQFTGSVFESVISGSGSINLKLDVSEFRGSIAGDGAMDLDGQATDQYYRISGEGSYRCFGLAGETADIDISGSGNVEVNVTNTLHIKVSGSGNIYYMNSPQITQDISGTAQIVHVP